MVRFLKTMLNEPLLHFLLIGAGLFILFDALNGPEAENPNRIVVSSGQVELLAANYSRTWRRQPNQQEVNALIEEHLRDEVFYREAIELGLDKDDSLIRRRLRQKLEFVLEDVSALVEPTDEQLTLFMQQNEESFRLKPKISFRHVYLSFDKRNDVGSDAVKLLARLKAGEDPDELGDTIMLASEFQLTAQPQIARGFGDEFAKTLLTLPQGNWTGPVLSGFGAHLVFISERTDGRMPALDEVRKAVKRDWTLEQRKTLKEKIYRTLLEKYHVVIEPRNVALENNSAAAGQAKVLKP